MRNHKVAVVTGASSGFGELTARLLAESGFKVFGTSRRSGAIGGGVEMLELDVTLQASVDATWVPRWKTWLPEGWFMAGMRRRFHLK